MLDIHLHVHIGRSQIPDDLHSLLTVSATASLPSGVQPPSIQTYLPAPIITVNVKDHVRVPYIIFHVIHINNSSTSTALLSFHATHHTRADHAV